MTTAGDMPSKPNRATWRDWLPPGLPEPDPESLLTKEQVFAALKKTSTKATNDNLRYWQHVGLLPKPVRRWHDGATRALYPSAIIDSIRYIRRLQEHGLTLDEIGSRVRRRFAMMVVSAADADADMRVNAAIDALRMHPISVNLSPLTRIDLWTLAQERERLLGVPTKQIEVRVVGEDGRFTKYTLDIA